MLPIRSIIIPMICLVVFITACEKPDLSSSASTLNQPVVQAYFHPGRIPEVKITQQIPRDADSTESRDISGLIVQISSVAGTYLLTDQGNGIYKGDGTWTVRESETYQLSFEYEGATIQASTIVPTLPQGYKASGSKLDVPTLGGGGFPSFPDPIELTWDNNDGSYYLIVVENIESDPDAIFDDAAIERPSFRSEPEQTNRYELGFQSFSYFGTHRVILFKINPDYASLYDDNGTSSQNLTTPFTNITGGLGIFTGINSDTLFVEVE